MKIKPQISILTATIALLLTNNSLVRADNQEAAYKSDRINFYCGEYTDKPSGETFPATMAYVPQRKASVSIVAWKFNYIPAWDAQTRCDEVSPKFQTFFENNRLNYLTTGVNNGYDIVCAAVELGQVCKPEDQLFQVKANDDPQAVLKELTGIIEGKSSEPIYQSSGQRIYVSMEELVESAPIVEEAEETDSTSN